MYKVIMLQGKRPHMEDRARIIDNFHGNYSLFVLCDGHGGDFVADFCVRHIASILKKHLDSGLDMKSSLTKTNSDLDDLVSEQESYMTGTTCIVILKSSDHVWVSNCGDSRAIMNSGLRVIDLSKDHKPIGNEQVRIEALGGHIQSMNGDVPRVNGELALTRAIGDKRLRPYVIPTPDVSQFKFSNDNKFIIMATDGLWDIMTSSDVNRMVFSQYRRNMELTDNQLLEKISNVLEQTIKETIEDNTTIIITHIRR